MSLLTAVEVPRRPVSRLAGSDFRQGLIGTSDAMRLCADGSSCFENGHLYKGITWLPPTQHLDHPGAKPAGQAGADRGIHERGIGNDDYWTASAGRNRAA